MKTKFLNLLFCFVSLFFCFSFASCSDDDEDQNFLNQEHDACLFGEWVESSDNHYVFDYYDFGTDGSGIHGSYESDLDWVNEDEHFHWYTVNDEYVYINGYKHKYSCNGTSLSLEVKPGRTKYYYSK